MKSTFMNPASGGFRCLAAAIRTGLDLTHACRTGSLGMLVGLAALGQTLGYCANAAANNVYVVTTSGDPGPAGTLSLRQAVVVANGAPGVNPSDNVVQFAPTLFGSTITLTGGEIPINHPLTVEGPGADRITISGNDASRIFKISGFDHAHIVPVDISGLTLTKGNSASGGGAVLAAYAFTHLSDLTITESKAERGGGIRVDQGTSYIDASRFRDNSATISGGGIEGYSNDVISITHSTISGNRAGNIGGGILADISTHMYIESSLVSGNVAAYGPGTEYAGGGIAVRYPFGCGKVVNSTITGNFAVQGGGGIALIHRSSGDSFCKYFTTLINDTIVENGTLDGSGNGVFAQGETPQIFESILANNFTQGDNNDLSGAFMACDNLIKAPGTATFTATLPLGMPCPANIIGSDPLLNTLRDNGGPTLSLLPEQTSPAVKAGGKVQDMPTDQRGLPRIAPQDMGAVELQYPENLIFRNGFESSLDAWHRKGPDAPARRSIALMFPEPTPLWT